MHSSHTHFSNTLSDSQQREFSYLRLSVTDLCNFKCTYCLPNGYQGKQKSELSLNEIKVLVAAFAQLGCKKIRITGGEPSLRKDLLDIIKICKQQTGIEKVCITTNGYRLQEFLPQWINAGIDQVNISIDSLLPEHFEAITSSSDLPNILNAIDTALANNFTNIKINTVLLREHLSTQILPLLNWIKTRPFSLRFIELMETGNNKEFFAKQHASAKILRKLLSKQNWQETEREAYAGPAEEFSHDNYLGAVGIIAPYSKNFCSSCNRLRVSSQGHLHLCLFGSENYDLRPYLQDPLENYSQQDNFQRLKEYIKQCMQEKLPQHYLENSQTGITQHFAMLGG